MLLNFSCSYFWLQGWIPSHGKQQLLWRSSRVSGYGAFLHIQPAPSWLCSTAWPQLLHDALSSCDETLTLKLLRQLCKPWLHYRWFVQVTLSSSWIRAAYTREMCNDPITQTAREALFLPPMSHCFPSFLALPRGKTVTSCTFSDSDSPTCNSYPKSSDKHVQNRKSTFKITSTPFRPVTQPSFTHTSGKMWPQDKSPWWSCRPLHRRFTICWSSHFPQKVSDQKAMGSWWVKTLQCLSLNLFLSLPVTD